MGIYGALSSAVTGLRAQSHALENISGNIANSQTTAYKRLETDFVDLIPDAPLAQQVPGAVLAKSRSTNDVQGDIQTVSTETFIALNSNGFFVVEPSVGQSDGNPVFAGTNYYTRRGDFQIDKDGLLVNGAGYYLKGLPIDTKTGNVSGSVPEVIKLSNAFLPAQQTERINYQANLPQLPKNAAYNPAIPNSELMKTSSFSGAPATANGAAATTATTAASLMAAGTSITLDAGGTPVVFDFYDSAGGPYTGTNQGIDIGAGKKINVALSEMQSAFRANAGPDASTATFGLSGGQVAVTLGDNKTATLTVSADTTALALPATSTPVAPLPASTRVRLGDGGSGFEIRRQFGCRWRHYGLRRQWLASQCANALGKGGQHRCWWSGNLEPLLHEQ
ncbi:flagellar hook-basal body complex protein [Devosia algicola]|uniref:Flagellar hook protein FlgE n=1 Tax=Devosia algicola TaxID=3026418 RepID=A0ABY7YR12_9HYPH|nr:flagellar hook-basal body complex protein [Devosia algicola]WDR03770.1 flagellar hook-basal body complex protein [Devosia algicola]